MSPPSSLLDGTSSGVRFGGRHLAPCCTARPAGPDGRRPPRAHRRARRPSAFELPPCPTAGVVCPCSKVTVDDLQMVWDKGFQHIELVKRASLCGTGTCQGSVCMPHLRAFVTAKSGQPAAPFTGRPASRQLTIGEAAADMHLDPFRRTALHDEHLALGRAHGPLRRMVAAVELRQLPRRVLGGARGRVARRRVDARQDDRDRARCRRGIGTHLPDDHPRHPARGEAATCCCSTSAAT